MSWPCANNEAISVSLSLRILALPLCFLLLPRPLLLLLGFELLLPRPHDRYHLLLAVFDVFEQGGHGSNLGVAAVAARLLVHQSLVMLLVDLHPSVPFQCIVHLSSRYKELCCECVPMFLLLHPFAIEILANEVAMQVVQRGQRVEAVAELDWSLPSLLLQRFADVDGQTMNSSNQRLVFGA